MSLRVGTRQSALATTQTAWVVDQLKKQNSALEIETVLITTSGDRSQTAPTPGEAVKGMFTKELDDALLNGRIDLAVHSFKDIPPGPMGALEIAAVPQRENASEAWISRTDLPFAHVPGGARIGTSSVRRRAEILHARPDLEVVPLRGNVDTRLRKLRDENEPLDGIILAYAGLKRLGLHSQVTEILSQDSFLPAAGQGALALVVRATDLKNLTPAFAAIKLLNHSPSYDAALCEQSCLHVLSGSCRTPIAVHAALNGAFFSVRGIVMDPEGRNYCAIQWTQSAQPFYAVDTGRHLAEKLLEQGAGQLLKA
jgi:hydroxymethylbilane synthase